MEQLLTGWPLRHLAALPYDPFTCSDLCALLQFFFFSPYASFLSFFFSLSFFSSSIGPALVFPERCEKFRAAATLWPLSTRSLMYHSEAHIYTLTPVVLETDGARPKLQARLRNSPTSWDFLVRVLTFSMLRCLIRYRPGACWDSSGRRRIFQKLKAVIPCYNVVCAPGSKKEKKKHLPFVSTHARSSQPIIGMENYHYATTNRHRRRRDHGSRFRHQEKFGREVGSSLLVSHDRD